jgi:CDP-paratose 2-epimerase
MEDPPLLENTVKLVILAPLLDLAGFYRRPFRIETETSIAIEMEDEGVVIRGRIDILVIKEAIWLVAIPFDDFDTNAVGTLNLLEATRRFIPESPFVHLSTNKVYGDAPNEIPLVERETRWDYADPLYQSGIPETFRIDQSKHSLFGASKVAADIMVQEYGRYFGLYSCCLRGGCLTGPNHSGVELHGFLSYLVKCNIEDRIYKIYGYKGKQVRDNIHSQDVSRFIEAFIENPRSAEVYNLGGGKDNTCSILESFEIVSSITGKSMKYEYIDQNREGDHICYYSDLRKMQNHYPNWQITKKLRDIFEEISVSWMSRLEEHK